MFAQHVGILSAQLSSMYLMYRESLNIKKFFFGPKVPCARTKDNLCLFDSAGSVIPCLESLMTLLASAYAMPLQREVARQGSKWSLWTLSVSIRRKVIDHSTVKHVWRWPDPWSRNITYVLRS